MATFITYLSILSFMASIAVSFIVPIDQSNIGTTFMAFRIFFDVVDGEIARLTQNTSSRELFGQVYF